MIREAKTTTCYTGAGLSKSSGIPDYATKAKNSIAKVKKISKSSEAEPTYAHHVLAAMEKKGYIQHYVQQNHDGLPQKAGFPQTKMNEIHGAWFDPSNPVIMFSGNLRGDLFEDLEEIEYKSTLCLCLGTSLSGMNADRTADTPAERAVVDGEEGIQGTVVINIQKTRLDKAGHCSLRVWGLLDDVFKLLAEELQLNVQPRDYRTMFNIPPNDPALLQDQYYVPYNKKGQYDPNSRMLLDLRPNMPFVIPNPESSYHKRTGFVRGRSAHGDFDLKIDQCKYRKRLGKWWIQDLIDGVPAYINLMNTNASVVTIS
jgi:NAD-dependent SIR2 family protein deacetylase